MNRSAAWLRISFAALLAAAPAVAVRPPETSAAALQFRADSLVAAPQLRLASSLESAATDGRLLALGVAGKDAYLDLTTGRFATLRMGQPIVPGRGLGNQLSWSQLGAAAPKSGPELAAAVDVALRGWLAAHADALRIDLDQVSTGKVTALNDDYVFAYYPRVVDGIPVRDSEIVATIKYGNLILFGASNWADFNKSAAPRITADDAREALRRYVGDGLFGKGWRGAELVWVPVFGGDAVDYRLAWIVRNDLKEEGGMYEALVAADDGEVLELQDRRQFVATRRNTKGGVLPVSNDNVGPDGVEQAGWPMPFSTVQTPLGPIDTDFGGNAPLCIDGSISGTLSGPLVAINDACGVSNLSSATDIDWGTGPTAVATDCTTPGFGGAGNTKSARTGYHELTMLKLMAQGWLPNNTWLQGTLTANMNIALTCNAFWNGSTVNFYRSGGPCNNTGEIAAIFDHEWGHGMDNNGPAPSIASPGEAIADIYASLRLDTSCIGRHFQNSNCGGYGNACTACTGVREIDYALHSNPQPALIAGIGNGSNNNCPATGTRGPCNREVHCEGMAPAQAVWDLWNRQLVSPPFSLSKDAAREIASQMSFVGAGTMTAWYTCDTTGPDFTGGCAANLGYSTYLAADDDDGNLGNGTPHWQAINDAFDTHQVGCSTDTPVNFGCSGGPASAPTVTATATDQGVNLSWTAVANAAGYRIFRTDGVFGCDFGKILIAEVGSGTLAYSDTNLQNGRQYSYIVVPMGTADECFGVPSSCSQATPLAAAGSSRLAALTAAATYSAGGGDGDGVLDNCEALQATIPVSNVGTTSLTNLRITAATSTSHPSSVLLTTLPVSLSASLAACGQSAGTLSFQAVGLAQGDAFEMDVTFSANELANPLVAHLVATTSTEIDFQNQATFTWNFPADAQGWAVEAGTFGWANSGVGAPSPDAGFLRTSQSLTDQCDRVRSPQLRLTSTSTMSLQNHFDIEPFYAPSNSWYDRANVAFRDSSTSALTVLSPSSGRMYNASGPGGTCGTDQQPGWAASSPSWAASNWTSGAMQTGTLAGDIGNLVFRYGTDAALSGTGFRFDQLTLTNFDLAVADAQSNSCTSNILFIDGFQSSTTAPWSSTVP